MWNGEEDGWQPCRGIRRRKKTRFSLTTSFSTSEAVSSDVVSGAAWSKSSASASCTSAICSSDQVTYRQNQDQFKLETRRWSDMTGHSRTPRRRRQLPTPWNLRLATICEVVARKIVRHLRNENWSGFLKLPRGKNQRLRTFEEECLCKHRLVHEN